MVTDKALSERRKREPMTKYTRNWFSNYEPCEVPFTAQGITYYTVEAFFQAMKTHDIQERRKVAAMSPSEAKRYCGPRNKQFKLRDDWETIKNDVMLYALRKKFLLGTADHAKLLATNDKPIVEWNNWHDNIWGECNCITCVKAANFCGPAQNRLGKLLMQLREELRR